MKFVYLVFLERDVNDKSIPVANITSVCVTECVTTCGGECVCG